MAGPRLFDHDEAVRLRAEGLTYKRIAAHMGVSEYAVYRVVKRQTDPQWKQRENRYQREYQRRTLRKPCAGCARLVWSHSNRSGLCPACSGLARSKGVRPNELQCARCEAWKDDLQFPRRRLAKARRGRHMHCRACSTIIKQEYRERRKVPCVGCGKPALPSNEKGTRGGLAPRCLECFRASQDFRDFQAKGAEASRKVAA